MKKLNFLIIPFLLLFIVPVYSAVYEASTLYNSVSRSETVQDLYMKRWETNKEKNFYFDIYGKINWIFDFDVNSYNAGTDKYEATELRLTRTYGSMTLAIPITGFRKTPDKSDFIIALTTTGFHYGLTRDIDVKRNTGDSESISDYKHSQFFDDIYAVSILYRPYFTLHGGYIFNNEYIPEDDGTMDYADPVKSYRKKFVAIELYKAMAFSMNLDNNKPESTKGAVTINQALAFVTDTSSIYFPVMNLGVERTAAYNDKPYDSVWVNKPKDTSTDYKHEEAVLNIVSFDITQRFAQSFTIKGFLGAQYITEDIYAKTDDKKIKVSKAKEWYIVLSYDPLTTPDQGKIKAYTGVSWYWDPAIALHREEPDKGNSLYGWIIGCDLDFKHFGGDLKAEYNYSDDLKKLVEASDKWSVEGSIFLRI